MYVKWLWVVVVVEAVVVCLCLRACVHVRVYMCVYVFMCLFTYTQTRFFNMIKESYGTQIAVFTVMLPLRML